MKQEELLEHAKCSLCRRKIGESGLPLFWRVTVERFGIDMPALRRQAGLEMMLGGNAAIAHAMGPDEDLAVPIGEPTVLTVCETCCTTPTCVASLGERGA